MAFRGLARLGCAARLGAFAGVLPVLPQLSPLLAGICLHAHQALATALGEAAPPAPAASAVLPARLPLALQGLVLDVLDMREHLQGAHTAVREALASHAPALAAFAHELEVEIQH